MGAMILAHKVSRIIGVIMFMEPRRDETVLEDPFSSTLLGALEEEIRTHDYYMMVHTTSDEAEILRLARSWKMDGLVLVWVPRTITSVIQSSISRPVVFIDSYFNNDGFPYHSVGLDDELGGYLLGKHLVTAGHSSIAFVANDSTAGGADNARYAGLTKAYREAGISLPDTTYFSPSKARGERLALYDTLRRSRDELSAIAFSSDYYAVEAMNWLQDEGIAIPEDISITGFDDNIFARIARPRLTTIHQDVCLKGKSAVDMLMLLVSRKSPPVREIRLPVHLVVRDSVCMGYVRRHDASLIPCGSQSGRRMS